MTGRLRLIHRTPHLALAVVWFLSLELTSSAQQFRGLWVDGWGAGFKSPGEVAQLIADARAANFNAVVVQVRRRGDAFYNDSPYEPKAADSTLSSPSFDSLAELIAQGHNTNIGPRIEIHAWVVTYNIWNGQTNLPSQANHPYRLHTNWLTQTSTGTKWDGGNYAFDPGHPEVQKHTFNVAMDIISRYDIDGFNWDYIRYADTVWGYNPVAVTRFNQKHGRTGSPTPTDATWMQFRRDQVTSLVRKVYLSAIALKPQIKMSADTITWAPGVTTDSGWTNSARAYNQVLQDWRSWMEEGIIDLNIPMAYFDQGGAYVSSWNNWNLFAKERRYNRHVSIGPGIYLNTTPNAIAQIRHSLAPTPGGQRADGVCGYSYRVVNKDQVPRSTFLAALVNPSSYDPVTPPVFATPATPPVMPWKANPTKGHLKGFVYAGSPTTPLDGANLNLSGPVNRSLVSDATGFYGAVDLLPGNYTIIASHPGMGSKTQAMTIQVGAVTNVNLVIPLNDNAPPLISSVAAGSVTDVSAGISWTTDEAATSEVEYSVDTSFNQSATAPGLITSHVLSLTGLTAQTLHRFRVRSADSHGNEAVSGEYTFTTGAAGQVADIIIDNPAALVAGTWTSGTASGDKYGADYRYKSSGGGAGYLEYRPNILSPGQYGVHAYYPQGVNRPTNAPVITTYSGGSARVLLNQQANGGRWNLVGTYPFAAGTSGHVRISDDFVHDTKVVMADAIKFVFVSPPVVPPAITQHPESQSVFLGEEAVFGVTAGGTAPLRYQWRFEGGNILNATGAVHRITAVQEGHAGSYDVRVSNSAGTNFSSASVLTVLPPPVPRFESISILGDGRIRLVITVDSPTGYVLQTSTNGINWADRVTIANPGETFEYLDDPPTNGLPRFYRTRSND